jgi:hypothetical protein
MANVKLLKLNSKDLNESNWNFKVDYNKALNKGYVIALAPNQAIRWIYEKRGVDIDTIGKVVGELKKQDKKQELDELLFMHEIVQVDFTCKGHLNKMLKKGLTVTIKMNDKKTTRKYKYLVSKGGTVLTFIEEDLYGEISGKLNADRNIQTKVHAAKLSAYKSLAFTSSKPVSAPKNVIVIPDCKVHFVEKYLWVGETEESIQEKTGIVERNICDGCCLITPELAKQWSKELELDKDKTASSYQVRYLWTKGILFPVDFKKYCIDHGCHTIVDVWGTERSILDADVILNESMVKLWNAYDSMEHWLECADKHGYGWRIGKYSKEDKWGNSNYQQLLPMDLTDDDCREFIQPQIELLDKITCGDYASAYLYLNGTQTTVDNITSRFNEDVDTQLATALMIEPKLLDDKFLKAKIHSNLARTRDDMRVGHCWVDSNYQIIVSDPIQLLEHLCGVKNPKGVLKAGEIYSKKHMDKGIKECIAFRSPMLISQNIVKVNIPQIDEEYTEYFKYLDDVYCVNGQDLMNESLCGFDEDGDTLQLLCNDVFMRAYEKLEEDEMHLPVICAGVPSSKVVVENDEQLLEVASIMLGNSVPNIGSVINIFSQLYTVRGQFNKDSKDEEERKKYEILTKRLLCGQCISQATIDAKKSGVFFEVPKHWYQLDACKELDDREFQESICATQKPYFFIHNYVELNSDYIEWEKRVNIRTSAHWNMSASDFLKMNVGDMSEEQVKFYNFIKTSCPININDKSTMKTFTDVVDEELKRINKMGKVRKTEDTRNLLKYDGVDVDQDTLDEVQKLFNKYADDNRSQVYETRNSMALTVGEDEKYKIVEVMKEEQEKLAKKFKEDILEKCNKDIKVAVNALIEVTYNSKKTGALLWNTFGKQIINNLLEKNNYMVHAVVQDENGDIDYKGKRYSVETVCVK